jgi:hypothetical protein
MTCKFVRGRTADGAEYAAFQCSRGLPEDQVGAKLYRCRCCGAKEWRARAPEEVPHRCEACRKEGR